MSISQNDGLLTSAPKPSDLKMYVGDGPYYEYASKELIPPQLRFKGMIVYEMLSDVHKTYRLETGIDDVDYKEITFSSVYTDNHVIATVDELSALDSQFGTVTVSDIDRGGIFVYVAANAAINNGGTIFDGWTRQYSGAVNVKWFGAIADDDTIIDDDAFKAAYTVATEYISTGGSSGLSSRGMYIPSGRYVITENNIFGNPELYGSNNFAWGVKITGDGKEQTVIKFKPIVDSAYLYDQRVLTHGIVGLEISDIHFVFDNSESTVTSIHGFYVESTATASCQQFNFTNLRFNGTDDSVLFDFNGDTNADRNIFTNIWTESFKNILKTSNAESVIHTFIGCQFYEHFGDMFNISSGGNTITCLNSTGAFSNSLAEESAVINTKSANAIKFIGFRIELHSSNLGYLFRFSQYSATTNIQLTFDSCSINSAGDTKGVFAKLPVALGSNITFLNCVITESSVSTIPYKVQFIDNLYPYNNFGERGKERSVLSFINCFTDGNVNVDRTSYIDTSSLTVMDRTTNHVINYKGCHGIKNMTEYTSTLRQGRTSLPYHNSIMPFVGYQFPNCNVSGTPNNISAYFRTIVPLGAFVRKCVVIRPPNTTGKTDYQLELVDIAEFLSAGSGVVYGTSTAQNTNISLVWELDINQSFANKTQDERTMYLRESAASVAGVASAACYKDTGTGGEVYLELI